MDLSQARVGTLALALLWLPWVPAMAQDGELAVGICLSDDEPRDVDSGAGDASVVVSRIAARTLCEPEGPAPGPPPSIAGNRGFLLQAPDAAMEECWLAGLPRLAGPGAGAESTYLIGEGPELARGPADYAFLIKRAAIALRAADPTARVLVGPVAGGSATWLDQVLGPGTLPYADGLASAPDALPEAVAARDRLAPGLDVWSIECAADGAADAGPDAVSRAARALALGARVSVVRAGPDARRGIGRFADLLEGGFQTAHTSGLLGAIGDRGAFLELMGGLTGDERLLVLPPHGGLTVDVGPPAAGRAVVLDLMNDTRADVAVRGHSERQLLRLPPAPSPTAVTLFTREDRDQERLQVTTDTSLTAAEIIALEQETQARQHLALAGFEANARIEYHFTISNLNESIDVTTDNDAFGGDDAIEYRQRAFYLNGLPWKGKPPALPFIAPERVSEVPLRIALDEGYDYRLDGIDPQDGRSCYRIAFDPISEDSADFRGTVWIDREVFSRVRLDLVRLRPAPPASTDTMTQWFEPLAGGGREYWLMSRTEGQMLLSAMGRSIVLERKVVFSDFVINPEGFDERRRAAHASSDPMYRDSLDEGLVALRPGPDGEERIPHDATTKSNTMLVGGWGGSTDGDVGLPFAGFNWFDLNFRNTGAQVDLAWGGPVAILAVTWPIPDSPWLVSVDSMVSAVPAKDRHTNLAGRAGDQDLRRQEQLVEASFRRTLGPFFSVALQPSLAYRRATRNSSTSPDFLLPPDTLEGALGLRFEFQRNGYELALWTRGTHRDSGGAFGLPDDASRLDVRDNPRHYGLQFSKSFHTHRLDRFSIASDVWVGEDLDRFSAFAPGVFPGLRIRGYDSKGLRFTRGVTGDFRYALPPTGKVRFELAVGGAVFENPEYYGEDSQYAYGTSVAATFPSLWGTFLRVRVKEGIDSSLPVDGSTGSLRVEMYKTFDGWWPWTREARKRSAGPSRRTTENM